MIKPLNTKLLTVAVVCLATTFSMAGQTPRLLKFESSVIEIDTVRYDAGSFNVRFVFENISDKDVSIIDVHTQCGCTKPLFSRASLHPGCKGHIDVEFNPSTLFAEQKRHMTVIATNGDYRKFSTLTIHGYVLRDISENEVKYPYELSPGLRSQINTLGMRLNNRGEVSEKSFTIYNDTDKEMTLKYSSDYPDVKAAMPDKIAPHSQAKITVFLDTAKLPKGDYIKKLFVFADGKKSVIALKGAVK